MDATPTLLGASEAARRRASRLGLERTAKVLTNIAAMIAALEVEARDSSADSRLPGRVDKQPRTD